MDVWLLAFSTVENLQHMLVFVSLSAIPGGSIGHALQHYLLLIQGVSVKDQDMANCQVFKVEEVMVPIWQVTSQSEEDRKIYQ